METIYVSFRQTGRGLTYLGQMDFQELISRNSEYLFEHNRDSRGRFCTPYYTDGCGNIVCDDINGLTGRIDYDGLYNTEYTVTLDMIVYSEIQAIFAYKGFKGLDVTEAIEAGELTLD